MAISHLKIKSFRNHKEKNFSFNDGITVIFGENGSGKTSILESIYVLSMGKSFKTNRQKEMIKKGNNAFFIKGDFIREKTKETISILIEKDLSKKIKINDKNIYKRKELIGRNNIVVLSPEEQEITKGPAKKRRVFFDKLFSITSKKYLHIIQKYNKVLKQRNAILKLKKDINDKIKIIQPWNQLIIEKGLLLWEERIKNFKKYNNLFNKIMKKYDIKANMSLSYKEKIENDYKNEIEKNIEKDNYYKRTTFGPHLDDFVFYWNNTPIRKLGSQGEHKTFLVLLKLTELKYIKTITKEFPILLLDDLFATIDVERSKKIIKVINNLEKEEKKTIQTIITTTDMFKLETINFSSKNLSYELKR